MNDPAEFPRGLYFWKQAGLLWLGGVVGAISVAPYLVAMKGDLLAPAIEKLGGLAPLLAVMLVQTSIQLGIFTVLGLAASRAAGLGAPLTAALVCGRPALPVLKAQARSAVVPGLVAGAAVLGLLQVLGDVLPPELIAMQQDMLAGGGMIWKALLASFYGGISEELMLRLFLMGVLTLGLIKVAGQFGVDAMAPGRARFAVLWSANIVAAVLFGLGHLPAVMGQVPITAWVLFYALVGNAIVGLLAGWLTWRKGLEAAMIAHFSADIVLHVLPSAMGWTA